LLKWEHLYPQSDDIQHRQEYLDSTTMGKVSPHGIPQQGSNPNGFHVPPGRRPKAPIRLDHFQTTFGK